MIRNFYFFILIVWVIISVQAKAEKPDELMIKSFKSLEIGKYDDALKYAYDALESEKNNNGEKTLNYAVIHGRIGKIFFDMGEMKKAEEYYKNEVNLLENKGETVNKNYSKALNDLGCVYQYLGNYSESEKILKRAISLKKDENDNLHSYAVTLHNMAKLKHNMGDYENAEELFNKSAEIKEKISGSGSLSFASTQLNLGLLYQDMGNFSGAQNKIQKSIEIMESELNKNRPELKSAKLQLAFTLISLNQKDEATKVIAEIEDPEKIYKFENHPDNAPLLYNLAMIYWSQADYINAKRLLEKVLSLSEKQFGNGSSLYSSCLNSLGLVCWVSKNYNEAYKYLSQSVVLRKNIYGDKNPKYAAALNNIAGLLSYTGKKNEAEEKYLQSLKLFRDQIQNYFPFLSEKEKTQFYAMLKERFDLFNCFVIENYKEKPSLIGEMYNNQINSKAILLRDLVSIRHNVVNSGDKDLLEIFDKWLSMKEELVTLYSYTNNELKKMGKNIQDIEGSINIQEKIISKNNSIFVKEYVQNNLTWKDIQNSLSGDEAAVEILRFNLFRNGWTGQVYYVALIVTKETTENPELIILDNNDKLESMYIKNYNNSIRHKIQDNDSYKVFWKLIDEFLKDKSKIYISPDGVYNKINISGLQRPDGTYIIDNREIYVVANISDIKNIKNKNEALIGEKTACLFGLTKQSQNDGQESTELMDWKKLLKDFNIEQLPETKVEITGINKLLNDNKFVTNVFMEENANENNFKTLNKYNILHIATHGFFLTDYDIINNEKIFGVDIERFIQNPLLRSGLILSDDKKENGILTAFEVKNLNLDAAGLVVLSACETGAGEIKNGEGVYGLQRAFRIAGAQNVIMSLWKVDDLATQELMTNFYEYIVQGAKPENALKMAQVKLKQKYQHPYYWGGFILISN